jgi:hypothetical protein
MKLVETDCSKLDKDLPVEYILYLKAKKLYTVDFKANNRSKKSKCRQFMEFLRPGEVSQKAYDEAVAKRKENPSKAKLKVFSDGKKHRIMVVDRKHPVMPASKFKKRKFPVRSGPSIGGVIAVVAAGTVFRFVLDAMAEAEREELKREEERQRIARELNEKQWEEFQENIRQQEYAKFRQQQGSAGYEDEEFWSWFFGRAAEQEPQETPEQKKNREDRQNIYDQSFNKDKSRNWDPLRKYWSYRNKTKNREKVTPNIPVINEDNQEKTCPRLMCQEIIADEKSVNQFKLSGGHPDKGGDEAFLQAVQACKDQKKFCPTKEGKLRY